MPSQEPEGPPKLPVEGVEHVVAVGSGKGGVGKTTVAVNLAVALAAQGRKVGLMDADVYGPNVPRMMGVEPQPMTAGEKIQPLENFGVKVMSMGFLNPENRPLIWRGPMLHGVIQDFLRRVDWGRLDFLVVDLPPGTGDVQLSLLQTTPISGAVVVTTPSDVSLEDARKAVLMFRKVRAEILGIVENMSYLIAPGSKERIDVFGTGGGRRVAEELNVHFLGELPLDPEIRAGGDSGNPIALRDSNDPNARAFHKLARRVVARIQETGRPAGPSITVGD